jgi:hypothetical protein
VKIPTLLSLTWLGLAALVSLLWIRGAQTRRRADETLHALRTRQASLIKEIDTVGRRRAAVERTTTVPLKPAAAGNTGTAALANNGSVQAAASRTQFDSMAANPQAQVIWLQRVRAKAALAYGEFFLRRNLSPEQIERFLENRMRLEEFSLDLDTAVQAEPGGKDAARTLRQRSKADYEAALQANLGQENYQALLEYERTAWVRGVVVNTFAGGAALAGVPLTPEQGERLLHAALAATGNDTSTRGEELARLIDWELLDAQARQILTPEQFAYFRNAASPGVNKSRWEYEIAAAATRAREAEARMRSETLGN